MDNNLGNKNTMAKNIKYYCKKKGISLNRLATDLNIPPTTISNWVHANTYPRIDKIELMANYFGITKADLVEEPYDAIISNAALRQKRIDKLSDEALKELDSYIDYLETKYSS